MGNARGLHIFGTIREVFHIAVQRWNSLSSNGSPSPLEIAKERKPGGTEAQSYGNPLGNS